MLNMVFGNLFAALFLKYFSSSTGEIDDQSVFYLFSVFTIVAIVGTIGFLFLKNPKKSPEARSLFPSFFKKFFLLLLLFFNYFFY